MSIFAREILVRYPFIGVLSITLESLRNKVLTFEKVSGELKNYILLTPIPFKKIQNISTICIRKFIKIDHSSKKIYFEFGLKGGTSGVASNAPVDSMNGTFANIVWVDSKVFNKQNTKYYNIAPKNFFLKRFCKITDGIFYINAFKKQLIIIVSGSLARELIQKIKLKHILTIIVFCKNLQIYYNLIQVHEIISCIATRYKHAISIIQQQYLSIKENIRHIQYTASTYKSLYFLANATIDSNMINLVNIIDELTYLNIEKKDKIRKILETRKLYLAETIIYLYTTNYIYKKFNKAFKKDRLHKVILSTSLCLKDIMYNTKYYYTGEYVYRGIKLSDFSEYKNALTNSTLIFLPGFISASQSKNVARKFAGNNGIVLKIKLNKDYPYPHVKLTEEMSHFDREQEIIIMSHIPLYVRKIKENKNSVLLEQNSRIKFSLEVSGKFIELEFEDFFLVKDVKRLIKSKMGIPIQFQLLQYNGITFEDDKVFKSYESSLNYAEFIFKHKNYGFISHIAYLKVHKISSSEYLLKGKDVYGENIELFIRTQSLISEITNILKDRYKNLHYNKLYYKGKELSNDETLECLISKYSKINYILFASYYNGNYNEYLENYSFEVMKLRIKNSDGITFAIFVEPYNTVCYLKGKIQDSKGIPPDVQRIIFNGTQLEDEKRLEEYCIYGGCLLHHFLRLRGGGDSYFITVKTSLGYEFTLNLYFDKIIQIKYYIEKEENILHNDQILYYCGYELEDTKALSDYFINKYATIFVIIKNSGGSYMSVITQSGFFFSIYGSPLLTVKFLKDLFQSIEYIEPDKQRIFIAGKELKDGKKLGDYIIPNSTEAIVVLNKIGKIAIFLKFLTCEELIINVEPYNSVEIIKFIFETITLIPISKQRLLFKGNELENEKTLEYYNIQNQATLHVKFPIIKKSALINKLSINNLVNFKYFFKHYCDISKITKKSLNYIFEHKNSDMKSFNLSRSESYQFKIFIVFFSGKTLSINTFDSEKILEIKLKIQKLTGIPYYEQILAYSCFELNDDETVLLIGITKNSIIFLIPLLRLKNSLKGIKAYINKHHIGNSTNLKKLIFLLGYSYPVNFRIYFEGVLIKNLDQLPNHLCCIYIDRRFNNQPLFFCEICFHGSINIVSYKGLNFCNDHFDSLLKPCDLCRRKSISTHYVNLKNKNLCNKCDLKGLSYLTFIGSFATKGILNLYKAFDNSILYQSNNSAYVLKNSCDHLHIIRELEISYELVTCVSKDRQLIFFIDSGALFAKNIQDDGYAFIEYNANLNNISLMISSGNTIVLANKSFVIIIFSIFIFKLQYELNGHKNKINCMEITSNNKFLFSSENKLIKMWSLDNRRLEIELKGHVGMVTCMRLNKANNLLVSGSVDRMIIVWNLENITIVHKFQAHKMEIRGLAISDDNMHVISGGQDWCLNVWSLVNFELVTRVVEKSWVNFVEITSDCNYVYSSLNNGTINCYALN